MKQELFRKKTLDHLSSPEQLTDYIRVSNPAMWMVLSVSDTIFKLKVDSRK